MLWTDETDALLRELCASSERLSARGIAARIGAKLETSLSRQAIIGRARRLGVALPVPAAASRGREVDGRANREDDPPSYRPRPTYRPEPPALSRVRSEFLPEPPGEAGVYLINAAFGDCRMPVNAPAKGSMLHLRVCGEPVEPGKGDYCTGCYPRAYSRSQS